MWSSGDHNQSIEVLRTASDLNQSPRLTNALGMAVRWQGKLEEAIQCHTRALSMNPQDPKIMYCTGVAHYDNGDHEQALELFERACAQVDNLSEWHIHLRIRLADLWFKQGQCDKTVHYLTTPSVLDVIGSIKTMELRATMLTILGCAYYVTGKLAFASEAFVAAIHTLHSRCPLMYICLEAHALCVGSTEYIRNIKASAQSARHRVCMQVLEDHVTNSSVSTEDKMNRIILRMREFGVPKKS